MPKAVNFEGKGKNNNAVTSLCPQPAHGHIHTMLAQVCDLCHYYSPFLPMLAQVCDLSLNYSNVGERLSIYCKLSSI